MDNVVNSSHFLDVLINADWLTAAGTGVAVFISIIAFLHSRESAHSGQREEFRNVLCQLVNYRLEFEAAWSGMIDEHVGARYSSVTNQRRQILLSAAEDLANQLGNDVSIAEYLLLSYENQMDSDFADARTYLEKASKAKGSQEGLARSSAYRSLAASYFWEGEYRDPDKGRKYYEKAEGALKHRSDPYTQQLRGETIRMLAQSEIGIGNLEGASEHCKKAEEIARSIPQWHFFYGSELRAVAWELASLAGWFRLRQEAKTAQLHFMKALQILNDLANDDATSDRRGQILLHWAWSESNAGSHSDAIQRIEQAEKCFNDLSVKYTPKPERTEALAQAKREISARWQSLRGDREPITFPGSHTAEQQ